MGLDVLEGCSRMIQNGEKVFCLVTIKTEIGPEIPVYDTNISSNDVVEEIPLMSKVIWPSMLPPICKWLEKEF